jgi:putative N6-adenine-specific DNA methylase
MSFSIRRMIDIHMEEFLTKTLNKENYPGTNAWMITANLEALKYVGLNLREKIKLLMLV